MPVCWTEFEPQSAGGYLGIVVPLAKQRARVGSRIALVEAGGRDLQHGVVVPTEGAEQLCRRRDAARLEELADPRRVRRGDDDRERLELLVAGLVP